MAEINALTPSYAGVTYRRLDTYPLAVTVGLAVDDVFRMHEERWSNYRRWAAELSLLLLLGGLALARALVRQRRYRAQLARQAEQLARGNRELMEKQQRLGFVNDSLRLLNNIATLPHTSVGEKLTEALRLGRTHLGLELGIISHIEGRRYIVENCSAPPGTALKNGDVFEFGETYCSITLDAGNVVAISNMGQSQHAGHPCYTAFKLECYIGVPLVVQGEVYGTVNFSSAKPYKREFDEGDLEFMRLLGRWVGSVLDAECFNRQLRQLATTDSLTGIWNRRYFLEEAERDIERARRYRHPLSVVMLDIDHFKRVNDNFGHHAGDETLVAFTEACAKVLRAGDVFGRLGGEEFAILLQETEAETALDVCERLRSTVARIEVANLKGIIRITVSIGVAQLYDDESAESLLNRADASLYQAKQQGRDRVIVADAPGRVSAPSSPG
ncbi:MAG: diguanylate cyclase [Zoogloea sp.]|nr:diguanylate cyclase [Zoogloea sp.]